MAAYLDDHPNQKLAQQRSRRDKPSGLIVVHTAESALDVIGEDTGAEGVARYISERTTYGSYHLLVDSDSIVQVARFDMATYGDGTGSNDFAIHLSFACRAADWPGMSAARTAAFIANGARAAAAANTWLENTCGITVPSNRVTRAQSHQRVPGFISHGERDPGRRTDPGPAFPWGLFLSLYNDLIQEDSMAQHSDQLDRIEKQNEKILKRLEDDAMIRTRLKQLVKQGKANAQELAELQDSLDGKK